MTRKKICYGISLVLSVILSYFLMYHITSTMFYRLYQGSSRLEIVIYLGMFVGQTLLMNVLLDYVLVHTTPSWKWKLIRIVYVLGLVTLLFGRSYGIRGIELGLGQLLKHDAMSIWYNCLNYLLFVPLGYYVRKQSIGKAAGITLGLILCIETLQFVSARGVFDMSDILLNCMGIMTGYCVFRLKTKSGL